MMAAVVLCTLSLLMMAAWQRPKPVQVASSKYTCCFTSLHSALITALIVRLQSSSLFLSYYASIATSRRRAPLKLRRILCLPLRHSDFGTIIDCITRVRPLGFGSALCKCCEPRQALGQLLVALAYMATLCVWHEQAIQILFASDSNSVHI